MAACEADDAVRVPSASETTAAPRVDRIDHRLGEVRIHRDEAVGHTQGNEHRARRHARESVAIVRLGDLVARLAGAVAVANVVRGVVVALVEVPARDVVDVAVAVVVDAVGVGPDQVLAVDEAVGVGVGREGVVVDVDGAVAVAVPHRAPRRQWQLAGVEGGRPGEAAGVPLDAAVEDGDEDVGTSRAALPGAGDVHPGSGDELPRVPAGRVEVVREDAGVEEEIRREVGSVRAAGSVASGVRKPGGSGAGGGGEEEGEQNRSQQHGTLGARGGRRSVGPAYHGGFRERARHGASGGREGHQRVAPRGFPLVLARRVR